MSEKQKNMGKIEAMIQKFKDLRKTATTVTTEGVTYHQTMVILYDENHQVLNTNGWQTVTTKRRINDYIIGGGAVWQDDWVWYYHPPLLDGQEHGSNRVEFFDGIKVSYDGQVIQ